MKIFYDERRGFWRKVAIGIVATSALGSGYVLLITKTEPERAQQMVSSPPQTAQTGQAELMPTPSARGTGAPARSALTTDSALTKAQQIDRYLATSNPVDAFNAYKLIRECVLARRAEREGTSADEKRPSSHEACGDITPSQVVSRLRPLETAAKAGVRGAYMAFVYEGPDGSGQPMSTSADNDPAEAEYQRKAHEFQVTAAENGDRAALMQLSIRAEHEEGDYSKSLAYWVAQEQVNLAQGGKANAEYSKVVTRLSQHLNSDQASSAIETGKRMAQAAQSSQYWSQN